METHSIFIKRLIEKDGLPKEIGNYFTDIGSIDFKNGKWRSFETPTWWLEEIHTPMLVMTEEELKEHAFGWHLYLNKNLQRSLLEEKTAHHIYQEYLNQLAK